MLYSKVIACLSMMNNNVTNFGSSMKNSPNRSPSLMHYVVSKLEVIRA